MLRANRNDRLRLDGVLSLIMQDQIDVRQGTMIAVDDRKFFNACQFSNMRKIHFHEEVQDALREPDFVRVYGIWTHSTLQDGMSLFAKVAGPEAANMSVYELIINQPESPHLLSVYEL